MHIKTTSSLCGECGKIIIGQIHAISGKAMMVRHCPLHGETTSLLEPDANFVVTTQTYPKRNLFPFLFLDVTRHCNMRCDPCYYPLAEHESDRPISALLALVDRTGIKSLCLTGGEPTTRDDLPHMIREFHSCGYQVIVLTNGVRLADEQYCDDLIASFGNLSNATLPLEISLHPASSSHPTHYALKSLGLTHLRKRHLRVRSLMFTLHTHEQLAEVLSIAHRYEGLYDMVRIRSASVLRQTRSIHGPIYISEMLQHVQATVRSEWDNNIYHLNVDIEGIHCRLIKWPDLLSVDVELLSGCGPYALTRDSQILNTIHANFVEEIRARRHGRHV